MEIKTMQTGIIEPQMLFGAKARIGRCIQGINDIIAKFPDQRGTLEKDCKYELIRMRDSEIFGIETKDEYRNFEKKIKFYENGLKDAKNKFGLNTYQRDKNWKKEIFTEGIMN